jgi:type II secretion system protein J
LSETATPGTAERSQQLLTGFTLLEILVALAVLSMIMSVIYGTYRAVTGSIVRLQPQVVLEQKGRFFVQRLSRQLRCCYGGQPAKAIQSTQKRSDGREDVVKRRDVLFGGGEALGDNVLLAFVTSGMAQGRESNLGYLKRVSYRLDSSQSALLTCEDLYGQPLDTDDQEWHVILEDVAGIEFEYFDGEEWRDKWSSAVSNGPPRAVRTKLVLESQDAQTLSFTWVIPVSRWTCERPKSDVEKAVTVYRDRTGS